MSRFSLNSQRKKKKKNHKRSKAKPYVKPFSQSTLSQQLTLKHDSCSNSSIFVVLLILSFLLSFLSCNNKSCFYLAPVNSHCYTVPSQSANSHRYSLTLYSVNSINTILDFYPQTLFLTYKSDFMF